MVNKDDSCVIISGGISGAITDPQSERAKAHAELYYEEIRHNTTDVERIAHNIGVDPAQILLIKNYLFMDEHLLGDVIKKFDPSFEIAESWRRLAYAPSDIKKHDLTLIYHELLEQKYMDEGMDQDTAHKKATNRYNYQDESDAYYESFSDIKKYAEKAAAEFNQTRTKNKHKNKTQEREER